MCRAIKERQIYRHTYYLYTIKPSFTFYPLATSCLQISCGITVEVLDDGEMTRLIYMKTRRLLLDKPAMAKHNTLVVHAGPGNTRTLYFKEGKIESYKSYRIGIYRARQEVRNNFTDESQQNQFLYDHINSQLDTLIEDLQNEDIQDIIFIGYEIQLIQPRIMGSRKSQCSIRV